eukprot:gene3207-3484_t
MSLLDDEPDAQAAKLQQLKRDSEQIDKENQLLESFLLKKGKSRRRKDAEAQAEEFQMLTDDEKSDLVSQAIEALQAEIEQTRNFGDKDVDDIQTLMEEVDLRIAETKKATYEFKRDIIIGGEDPRTGRINAEKVIKFYEDKIHVKEVLVEKLTLKNSTYKSAIAKLEAQLVHKEEMGEVLHMVDFDQLKIENQQYLERIDAKNKELLQLKLSTGRTVQVLNDVKGRLSALLAHGAQLRASIAAKQHELDGFDADFSRTSNQSAREAAAFKKLQVQEKETDQPQIMEYIKLKAQVADLQKEAAEWRRKVEVVAKTCKAGGSGKQPAA